MPFNNIDWEKQETIKQNLFIKIRPNEITESFSLVGGYEDVKSILLQYGKLLEYVDTLREWRVDIGGKLLLHGPPGTGKTMMVKALARELSLPLIIVKSVYIRSKYIAEAGQNIERLTYELKRHHRKTIVFFDEFDTLAMDRGKKDLNSEDQKVVNALLTAFDALSLVEDQILVIAATNYEEILDDAVWRRFDKIVFVNLPNLKQRVDILQVLTKKIPKTCINIESLTELAKMTEGWSGADLKRLINHGVLTYLSQEGVKKPLGLSFFQETIEAGVITPTTMKRYHSFQKIRDLKLAKSFDNILIDPEAKKSAVQKTKDNRLW